MFTDVKKLELGCGNNKREGFFGIDIAPSPCVDFVFNIEDGKPWPFEDNQIEYIYSSQAFEHFENFMHVIREIHRICKHNAIVEIWTPYGRSNEALLFGHKQFFTETHWKHICFEYDRFYLPNRKGFFNWIKSEYILYPGILMELSERKINLDFALNHMFNIALEFGVFLQINKERSDAIRPQIPNRHAGYERGQYIVNF